MRGLKLFTPALAILLVGFLIGSANAQFPKEGAGFDPTAPATIFTAVAYSDEEGKLIVYHVLRPGPFFTSTGTGVVYRFKDSDGVGCPKFLPVFADGTTLNDSTPAFAQLGPDSPLFEGEPARRTITDVFYSGSCPGKRERPRSEEEVLDLEAAGDVELVPDVDIVNAPSVPSPKNRPDWSLWEGAPNGANPFDGSKSSQSIIGNAEIADIVVNADGGMVGLPQMPRPRHKGFAEGKSTWYVTYEVCSDEQWSDTGFCSGDGVKDIFFIRYGSSIGETGMTNIAFGTPFPKAEVASGNSPSTQGNYSPIWAGACVGGNWSENEERSEAYEGTEAGFGPGGANCFGPTPQEVKDFTSSENLTLPSEIFEEDDPRHGAQIRTSADFAALDGMNGFTEATAPWAGKLKIINCPIFAVDLNNDRQFTTDEFLTFPNFVLEPSRGGNFTVFNPGSPFLGE
jgi:hypothetical protein